jgi:hypothetical protein
VRVRLLIDVETTRMDLLQQFVGEEPQVDMQFKSSDGTALWTPIGRFVGAKEAHGQGE